MPKRSARFSFTLNGDNDLDDELIEFLNSFSTPSERRLFIREALFDKMTETVTGGLHEINRIDDVEKQLQSIEEKIDKLLAGGIIVQKVPERQHNVDIDLSEAERGLENIWRK